MALLTTLQEYQAIREAIQTLTATGRSAVSISMDGMSTAYEATAAQLPQLQARELELARRLSIADVRKRTAARFI